MQYASIMLAVLLMPWVHGCAASATNPPKYGVGTDNESDRMLSDVAVRWDQNDVGSGVLGPRKDSTYFPSPAPLAGDVLVTWRTPDGRTHEQRVKVTPQIGPAFDGYVYFIIHGNDTVTVELRDH